MADEPAKVAETQPSAQTRAQEQDARSAYTAGLREVIG